MFDTADVYGDGRSETLIGAFVRDRDDVTVLTKMGRRAEQTLANYSLDHFREWNDRSRANLGVDTLDLVQLHCPPDDVYASDAVFDALDGFVAEGRIARYGVSVETCAQALAAIARPHVASVQIILNAFRMKPLDEVLPAAAEAGVAIIARVPLASGLLSGRFGPTRRSAPTTTATTTATARPSTSARPSPASRTTSGCDAAQRFAAHRPRPRRSSRPRSRCAGSSTSPASRPSSPARARSPGAGERGAAASTAPLDAATLSSDPRRSTTTRSARWSTTAGSPSADERAPHVAVQQPGLGLDVAAAVVVPVAEPGAAPEPGRRLAGVAPHR